MTPHIPGVSIASNVCSRVGLTNTKGFTDFYAQFTVSSASIDCEYCLYSLTDNHPVVSAAPGHSCSQADDSCPRTISHCIAVPQEFHARLPLYSGSPLRSTGSPNIDIARRYAGSAKACMYDTFCHSRLGPTLLPEPV